MSSTSQAESAHPVTLVTGSSTGIGLASALELARRGHLVWASMRDLSRGEALRAAADEEGLSLQMTQLDVTDQSSVERAVTRVVDQSGRIDNLVANAGFHAGNSLEDTALETFQNLMDTNYLGVVRCVKAVLPHLRDQGSGCIVGVSSQSGRFVMPTNAAYSASKFAVEAALEVLALEAIQFGVRVIILEPGLTFTAAMEKGVAWPEGTPYRHLYRRTGAIFAHDAESGSSAESVAIALADAIESAETPLRRVVGTDAERNLAGRSRIDDKDWLALHALERDEDFFAAWREYFGNGPDGRDKGSGGMPSS